MFATPQEAMDELLRRINVLGQAGYMYEGLALRMAADDAAALRDKGLNDSRFSGHSSYAGDIDVFEDPLGVHVSVPESVEETALRAELGTTTQRLQPMWAPRMREDEAKLFRFGTALAEIIAHKAEEGDGLADADIDAVLPMPDLNVPGGFTALKQLVAAREATIATEET